MKYQCCWCEKECEGYPVGAFLKRPHDGGQGFRNAHLCGACMVDPEATMTNFRLKWKAKQALKASTKDS